MNQSLTLNAVCAHAACLAAAAAAADKIDSVLSTSGHVKLGA